MPQGIAACAGKCIQRLSLLSDRSVAKLVSKHAEDMSADRLCLTPVSPWIDGMDPQQSIA